MKTLFVTCGATVPFPKLVSVISTKSFIQNLRDYGFVRLIVQFGKNYQAQFESNLDNAGFHEKSCSIVPTELGVLKTPVCRVSADGNFEIIGIEFSSKIQYIIKEYADLIISHAGTGSILDSLKLSKPLIVCVNDELMNNHQQQIADKFESLEYVWACKALPVELMDCLVKSQTKDLKPFQTEYNRGFGKMLERLAFQ